MLLFQNRLDNLTSAFGLLTLFRGFSSMIGPPINGKTIGFGKSTHKDPHFRLDFWGDKSVQRQLLCFWRLPPFGRNHQLRGWLAQEKERQVKTDEGKNIQIKTLADCGRKEPTRKQWEAEEVQAGPKPTRVHLYKKKASDQWTKYGLVALVFVRSEALFELDRISRKNSLEKFLVFLPSYQPAVIALCCENPQLKTNRNQCQLDVSV